MKKPHILALSGLFLSFVLPSCEHLAYMQERRKAQTRETSQLSRHVSESAYRSDGYSREGYVRYRQDYSDYGYNTGGWKVGRNGAGSTSIHYDP